LFIWESRLLDPSCRLMPKVIIFFKAWASLKTSEQFSFKLRSVWSFRIWQGFIVKGSGNVCSIIYKLQQKPNWHQTETHQLNVLRKLMHFKIIQNTHRQKDWHLRYISIDTRKRGFLCAFVRTAFQFDAVLSAVRRTYDIALKSGKKFSRKTKNFLVLVSEIGRVQATNRPTGSLFVSVMTLPKDFIIYFPQLLISVLHAGLPTTCVRPAC